MEQRRLNTGKSCNYIHDKGDECVKEHQGHVHGIGAKADAPYLVRRFAIKDFATLVLLYKITSRGV